ncbi:hypothetical protein SAMN05216553_108395 [Lentzea fradiae]|uniref:Uncharacterized protein n=1 Tax=Lentzea fradiae TaxID=200378 RepID=A0A1G7UTP6_9PSEU|nr:hypothetical protein [Lentzea fradiae]SDG50651.1 hypothetical protein SAMN05216553_108395 [Lentzea fradiae]
MKFRMIDGRRVPIGGGGGKSGAVVAAGVLALGLAGSGGLTLTGPGLVSEVGTVAGEAASGAGSGGSPQLRLRQSEGQKSARKGDSQAAWQRLGVKQLKRTARQQAECVAASFGQVRDFFTGTRCTSLERALFLVGDGAGNTAVLSVAWVGLASASDAGRFKTVIDIPGSGDIRPMGSTALDLADIRFTGENYGSDRDGRTVTIAETELVTGHFDHATLDAIAEVSACLPRI